MQNNLQQEMEIGLCFIMPNIHLFLHEKLTNIYCLTCNRKEIPRKFEQKTIRPGIKSFLALFQGTVPFKWTIEEGGPNI